MANNQEENDKPRVRPASVAAAYLLEKVRKMEKEEADIIEAAKLRHRERVQAMQEKVDELAAKEDDVVHLAHAMLSVKIEKMIAKAPAEVQKHYFALAGAGKDADHE